MDKGPEQTSPQPRIGEDGKPIYDQEFFLALARNGKDIWNTWRARNPPYIPVTFAGVDFSKPDNLALNFSGFKFGPGANFSECRFGDNVDFSGAKFGDTANFSGSRFQDGANFFGVTFGMLAYFPGATFGNDASFCRATFGIDAKFSGTIFGMGTDLSESIFDANADLSLVSFGEGASLRGARFGRVANLVGTSFRNANLADTSFGEGAYLEGLNESEWQVWRRHLLTTSPFEDWPDEAKLNFLPWPGDGPSTLSQVSFSGARFYGVAYFSGRTATTDVDFTSVRFGHPPRFDTLDNFNLYGAQISFASDRIRWLYGWTTQGSIALGLRRLRTLAEETNNHDLERDLYIEERKAERGIYLNKYVERLRKDLTFRTYDVASLPEFSNYLLRATRSSARSAVDLAVHCVWISIMGIYWLLSDYGRSLIRPLLALAVSVGLFHATYWYALGPGLPITPWPRALESLEKSSWLTDADRPFARATRAFSIANAVPFVGALTLDKEVKDTLICGELPRRNPNCATIPPVPFQLIALSQTIVSTLCVFFIALALRNYFRVK